jgi:hypothetical protein
VDITRFAMCLTHAPSQTGYGPTGSDKDAILSALVDEGLALSRLDDIAIVEAAANATLIKVTLRPRWPFARAQVLYGVAHAGLPFPVLFCNAPDAFAFYAIETAVRNRHEMPCSNGSNSMAANPKRIERTSSTGRPMAVA